MSDIRKEAIELKKASILFALVICLTFCLLPIGSYAEADLHESTGTAKAAVTIDILATSDVHGWYLPYDFAANKASSKGGLTLLSTVVSDYRDQGKEVILVDCGDSVQSNLCEWLIDVEPHPVITAFNFMGYDLWNLGNHEFGFSKEQRDNLVRQFNGTTLCGNVFLKRTDTGNLPATTVLERNGIRIGFIGMVTPLIVKFEENTGRLDNYDVYNPMDVMQSAINELREQNVDCIVALIHEGLEEERGIYGTGIRDIAANFPELDVIIGGHAHEKVECEYENGVLLCEPGVYAQAISDVELTFVPTDDGAELVDKTSRILPCGSESDSELEELLLPYQQMMSKEIEREIGQLIGADLSSDSGIKGISGVYTQPSGIMNLFGSVAMYYSGADCALYCTDNENAGFPVGPIKLSSIFESYTYTGGEVSVFKLSGRQLKKLLEWCADYFNQMEEGDLLPSYNPLRRNSKYSTDYLASGIAFEYDLTAESGNRVKGLSLIQKNERCTPDFSTDGELQCTPILDDDEIMVATTRYGMEGWMTEGNVFFGEQIECIFDSSIVYGDDDGTLRALTIQYIQDVFDGQLNGCEFDYAGWNLYTGVDPNSDDYQAAVEMLNDGTLQLHSSEDGHTNTQSITVEDVQAVQTVSIEALEDAI